MSDMQKQFEEWAKDAGYDLRVINADPACYANMFAEVAWQAWQASRAALVVELPDWFVSGIDAAMYRDDVVKALNAAGVAYNE